jgi:hypothetical protein
MADFSRTIYRADFGSIWSFGTDNEAKIMPNNLKKYFKLFCFFS